MSGSKALTSYVEDWGLVDGNVQVQRITLCNDAAVAGAKEGGLIACILTYGGIVQRLYTHDNKGQLIDVVLGCDNLQGYQTHTGPYFGAIIGRYANRLANGRFEIDGKKYDLPKNQEPNTLHGGNKGWDKHVWEHAIVETEEHVDCVLSKQFPDGEQGFPGTLNAKITYRMERKSPKMFFMIDCKLDDSSVADATVISITNHSYFNLEGHDSGKNINDHMCQISAEEYLEADQTNLPKGPKTKVSGTPFDFRKAKKLGRDIGEDHPQIKQGKGYDHSWWLGETDNNRAVGYLTCPTTGVCLSFETTQPAAQVYTANWIDMIPNGYKDGASYGPRSGIAFETANLPDAPNHADFPSAVLRQGQSYKHQTTWDFSHINK